MLTTLFLAALLSTLPGPYVARDIRVIDGDTFEATVQTWLQTTWRGRVRIADIDTPERHGACALEKSRAVEARQFLAQHLLAGAVVELRNVRHYTYSGGVWAQVFVDGTDLGHTLLTSGHAKPYTGRGPKPQWCPGD